MTSTLSKIFQFGL